MSQTYRDIVYVILDECKVISDDALLEVEHIIQIANKYRALLFNQKYKGKKIEIPFSWYQRLNVVFNTSFQSGVMYQSYKKIPPVLDLTNIWQYTFVSNDGIKTDNLNFINPQRFKQTGYNKWLKSQIYVTIDLDGYMYAKNPGSNIDNLVALTSSINDGNTETQYQIESENALNQLVMDSLGSSFVYYDTILDNPIDADRFNDINTLDVLDIDFPCEQSLIQPIIDLCIKEIMVINNVPRDTTNDASDSASLPKQQQN